MYVDLPGMDPGFGYWESQFFLSVFANEAQWSSISPNWLGFFITKYAFSPFWGIFFILFLDIKIIIFLDKLS